MELPVGFNQTGLKIENSMYNIQQERPLAQQKAPPANTLHNVTSRLMSNTNTQRDRHTDAQTNAFQ